MSAHSKIVKKRGNAILLRPKNQTRLTEGNINQMGHAKSGIKEELMHPLFKPLSPIASNPTSAKNSPSRNVSPPELSASPINFFDPLRSSSMESELSQNSTRFNSFVDRHLEDQNQLEVPTIVLSRRDALRAAQDEILSKSEDRIRLARCGLDHGREHKYMRKMREHVTDWVDYAHVKYVSTPPVGNHPVRLNENGEPEPLSARSNTSKNSIGRNQNPNFDSSHTYAPPRNIIVLDSTKKVPSR